jgi:hypothetical protein
MASRKRSRRPAGDRRRTSSVPKAQQRSPAPEGSELPPLDEMLGRFSDALDLLKTAHRALFLALQDDTPIGPEVTTLDRGIDDLASVYKEFDLTFLNLRRQ